VLNTQEHNWNVFVALPNERYQEFFNEILLGQVLMKEYNEFVNLFLFAQPKSASHHTYILLQHVFGLFPHPVGFGRKSAQAYYPRVVASKFLAKNSISRSHAHNSLDLSMAIRNLGLKPLVLTRNLFDSLVSRRDHVFRTQPGDDIAVEKEWTKFVQGTSEYQLDYVIEKFAPSIIEFFNSWAAYSGDAFYITYDDIVNDVAGTVERLSEWLGLPVIEDAEKIAEKIRESGGANFNKGVAGRGRQQFNDRQIAEIMRKAEILGCTDEEFLG
jgi:hypothetical protein